jgi:hypothetical protein
MVSRFISRGCLEVYHGVKVYWWSILGYIMVSRFTSGGYLEVYHGVTVY